MNMSAAQARMNTLDNSKKCRTLRVFALLAKIGGHDLMAPYGGKQWLMGKDTWYILRRCCVFLCTSSVDAHNCSCGVCSFVGSRPSEM